MKNILFLTWKDIKHPAKGGAEVVMYNYMKRLSEKGYNITWFASGFKGGLPEEQIDGIKIIRKFSFYTIYFFAWSWYLKFIKKEKIDIIVDEAGGIPLLSSLFIKKIPIVFFIHHIGSAEWKTRLYFPFDYIFKFLFGILLYVYRNKVTITVSNSTKQELVKNFGFKENNVFIIENACDITPIKNINFEEKENSILFLGRLMPIKRVEDAIKAFSYFDNLVYINTGNYSGYKLNIIGNDNDKQYVNTLKKLIKYLNLEYKVNFCGQLSQETLERELPKNKLILVPSRKEGFGLIVLEANSYGIPAIGYDVAGLRDSIKNGINGLLIEEGDWEDMGQKIYDLLVKNYLDYHDLAENSLLHVKSLGTWEYKTNELENIFSKII